MIDFFETKQSAIDFCKKCRRSGMTSAVGICEQEDFVYGFKTKHWLDEEFKWLERSYSGQLAQLSDRDRNTADFEIGLIKAKRNLSMGFIKGVFLN